MRKSYSDQLRFDCLPIEQVTLDFECRDEIVPVLASLQHLYSQKALRDQITQLIAADVNETTRADIGREGLSYWQILVLGVVRWAAIWTMTSCRTFVGTTVRCVGFSMWGTGIAPVSTGGEFATRSVCSNRRHWRKSTS